MLSFGQSKREGKAIAKERRAKQKVKGKLSFGQSNREGKPSGKTAVPEPKARERWETLMWPQESPEGP